MGSYFLCAYSQAFDKLYIDFFESIYRLYIKVITSFFIVTFFQQFVNHIFCIIVIIIAGVLKIIHHSFDGLFFTFIHALYNNI